MSFNSFSNTSISTTIEDTHRSGVHCYKMTFTGLRPSTKHKVYLDGVDYTWACRGWGQNLGEDIITDINGVAKVHVYYEIPFSRPAVYETKTPESIAYYSNRINNKNKRMEDVVQVQYKVFEIRSADSQSYATAQMHFHICIIKGDVNRIEQHD